MLLKNNYSINENKNNSNNKKKDLDSYISRQSKSARKSNKYFSLIKKYIVILIPTVIYFALMYGSVFLALIINTITNLHINENTGNLATKLNFEEFSLEYTIILTILAFIFTIICCHISFPAVKKELKFKVNKPVINIRYVITFIFISILLQFISVILQKQTGIIANYVSSVTYKTVIATLITTFIAPIYEEIISRYVIYGYAYRATKNKTAANIIQAVIFALFHMNLILIPVYYIGGYLLGLVRQKHGIKTSIFYHIVINVIAVIPFSLVVTNVYAQIFLSVALGIAIGYMAAIQFKKVN